MNSTIVKVKLTVLKFGFDYNPWDMPPDYGLEDEYIGEIFDVEIYPDLSIDENQQGINDQIHEEIGTCWNIDEIEWEVVK